MSKETATLVAEKRERTGSRYSQRLRATGQLPGVVYGHKQDSVHISVDYKTLYTYLLGGVHLINLELDGASESVLLKAVQYDYLGTTLIHADFTRIDPNEEVKVNVPVRLRGEEDSPGAKASNAIVELNHNDIEVLCAANNIPDTIDVDISKLDIGDSLHVKDLILPEGVRTELHAEESIVAIHMTKPAAEATEEVEPAAEGEAASE